MAIYHLTAKIVSRGVSITAAVRSDYIERCGRYASDHEEVFHKGHGNIPAWASDAPEIIGRLLTHGRANGRLFKQLEFAPCPKNCRQASRPPWPFPSAEK